MKIQFQDDVEDAEYKSNGKNGTSNTQWSEEDKEKGNLKKFNISKKTIKKLKARDVEFLFPVQSESYTSIYEQNDCLIQATKGSGKTLAFTLPLVELLQSDKSVELTSGRAPRVLVLAANRDITKQISDDFQSIVNDLSVVSIYSAKKKSDDQETAVANGCDILVATPDRLKEFIDEEKVDLSAVKHVVLDEIDQLNEAPVVDDLKKVLKQVFTTEGEEKPQLVIFSTMSPDTFRKLTKKYLSAEPVTINVSAPTTQETSADDEGFDETVNGSSANVSTKTDDGSRSLLSKQENYTTYQLSTNEEIKSVGFVYTILRKCMGDDFDAKATVSKVAFTKDFTTAVFDLPSEYDEQIQKNWQDTARTTLAPATQLPELDESSMVDNKGFSRGGGGGGNRNSGRSNGCFKCGKDGHKSFECPDAGGFQRNGGNRSGGGGGGGGCFNCGKDGHKSFECPEPKKAGGGRSGGAGGQRSNACFNCGKEGHRSADCSEPRKAGGGGGGGCFNCGKDGHKSFECPEPKKAGGGGGGRSGGGGGCFNCGQEGHRSYECTEPKKAGGGGGGGGCFNCGKDGHKSFDCPEPKKGRPSSGFGGRGGGGGRGGARGGGAKRTFGGHSENGNAAGEVTNKKIKFDDDDE